MATQVLGRSSTCFPVKAALCEQRYMRYEAKPVVSYVPFISRPKLLSSVCNNWTLILGGKQSDIIYISHLASFMFFVCVPFEFLHPFILLILTTALPF